MTTLSFSPDGRHLASLGCDDDHSIAVYDWRNRLVRVRTSMVEMREYAVVPSSCTHPAGRRRRNVHRLDQKGKATDIVKCPNNKKQYKKYPVSDQGTADDYVCGTEGKNRVSHGGITT